MQPPDPTAADKFQELLKVFETEISAIINKNRSDIVPKLVEKYKLEPDDAQITEYSEQWEELNGHASTLFKELKIVNCTSDWEKHVKAINEAADNLRNGQFVDLTGEKNSLSNFILKMSKLVANLKELKKFENSSLRVVLDSNVTKALKHFTDTANTIVTSRDYEASNLKQLDDLLADTEQTLSENFSGMALISNQSFVALAAPSMEGKTQAAFTLRRVKPLYFCLSDTGSSGERSPQNIYRNFSSLSQMLCACAKADVDSIKGDDEALKITTGSLDGLRMQKFWTIGFLVGLVTNCSSPAAGSNESWMGNYAKVKDFYFPQLSINDIPTGYFEGFCLFLDEYAANSWSIFVRNLARVHKMPCVCSNTNTKIANIIGKNEESGSDGAPVRSIVITRLNSPCLEYLDSEYDLKGSIQTLKTVALQNDPDEDEITNPICHFLNDFLSIQLKYLRPGAAVYIAKALKTILAKIVDLENLTIGQLLDFMVRQLASDIAVRKPSLLSNPLAYYAKIGLMVPQSYYCAKDGSRNRTALPEALRAPVATAASIAPEPSATQNAPVSATVNPKRTTRKRTNDEKDIEDVVTLADNTVGTAKNERFHQRKFIEFHLYYLVNPQSKDKWMFLTFLAKEQKEGSKPYLTTNPATLESWKHEYTHFEKNELLTMLACLSIPWKKTISTLLQEAGESIYSRPEYIFDNPNPLAMQVPGNPLEFSVAVSVADASQHSFGKEKLPIIPFGTEHFCDNEMFEYTFRGQTGHTFLKNLIVNLIVDEEFDFNTGTINVEFAKSSEDYLMKCRIPYLYSLNRSIALLDSLSHPASDFFVEQYIRTGNMDGTDGRFKFLLEGQIGNAVLECKNRQPGKKINPTQLIDIIDKACAVEDAKLVMIFFPEATKTLGKSQLLTEFCSTHSINVYNVIKTARRDFKVVPLFPESSLSPKYVCILFELNIINKSM